MRAVVQRVSRARVSVAGRTVAEIGPGLVAFVAVERGDPLARAAWLAEKLAGLRIFDDESGRLNRSVRDVQGSVLLVSNFTVAGDASRGRRPGFERAAPSEEARVWLEALQREVAARGVPVAAGSFGQSMQVLVECDGPVTLVVEDRGRTGGGEARPGRP